MEKSLTETLFYAPITKLSSSFNRSDNNNHFDFKMWLNQTAEYGVADENPCHVGKWQAPVTVPQAIKSSFGNTLNAKLIFKLSISIRDTFSIALYNTRAKWNRDGQSIERENKKKQNEKKNKTKCFRLAKSQRTQNKTSANVLAKSFR